MRDDYKITGPVEKVEVQVEKKVADKLKAMTEYSNLSLSELTNTALKRFIAAHKDFLPPNQQGSR